MQLLTQAYVNKKLRELGTGLLTPMYKRIWSPERPTTGYCYVVSEAIYHFLPELACASYCINLGEGIGTHWFLKSGAQVIDLTCNQFDFPVNHEAARRTAFLQGGTATPRGLSSKRGFLMAQHLGLTA